MAVLQALLQSIGKPGKFCQSQGFTADSRGKAAAVQKRGQFRFGDLVAESGGKTVDQGFPAHGKGGAYHSEKESGICNIHGRIFLQCAAQYR